jgi:2-polyprenyl-3-methyl-5-hydroxy-6-metoxy-1,4-benzoquinol methylase
MNLEESLKKYNREIYNDVMVEGKVLIKGARECSSRLNVIKNAIPENAAILDVGCHLGHFTIQLAYREQGRVVVGMEGNYQRARIAGEIAKVNKLENVIILNNLFTDKIALRWGRSCEAFNTILLLNVLHHCKRDQIINIVEGVKMLAPQIIIETPHVNESSACGTKEHREMIDGIQFGDYKKVKLTETETHTLERNADNQQLKRPMYLFYGDSWCKQITRPHYCHNTPSKHNHKIDFIKGRFVHRNQTWATGVNLGTMVALNMVYPTKNTLFESIEKTLNEHEGPLYDVNLWNMIYTPTGIKLIDFKDKLEEKSNKESALIKLAKQYDSLKKEGAKPLQVQNLKNWVKHIIVGILGRYRK